MKLHSYSLQELNNCLVDKKISIKELVLYFYNRLKTLDKKINSSITIREKDDLLKEIKIIENKKNNNLLFALPFVMKDAYITREIRTTAASKVLRDYIPQYSATVKDKLDKKQAILIAKNNQDAWGHGATSENTDFGPVRNPWNLNHSPGGSSGGTAAAIASGFAPFGIAEDTGGSIRNPASYCNLTGLKVSYGRVSRYGAIAYASSLDTVGPIAKSAADIEIILKAIKGMDKKDATTWEKQILNSNHKTLGIITQFLEEDIDPQVKETVLRAVKLLENSGYQIKSVKLPNLKYVVPVAYLIAWSETSSNLARYDGIRYGQGRKYFTPETKRRIMIGTFALSAGYFDKYYKKAQRIRTLIRQDFTKALKVVDAIIAPTSPILPPLIGQDKTDPLKDILADWYTYAVNLAGIPSLSIPVGFSKDKLPIGMQLIGREMEEFRLINIAKDYQRLTNWHKIHPQL